MRKEVAAVTKVSDFFFLNQKWVVSVGHSPQVLLQDFSFGFAVPALLLTCSVATQGMASLWNRYRYSL